MAEEKIHKALDLVRPEAFAPGRPARRASAGVAAAVLACSPLRTAPSLLQVRRGGQAAGGTGRRGAAWAGQGAARRRAACGSPAGNPWKTGRARRQLPDEGAARRNARGAAGAHSNGARARIGASNQEAVFRRSLCEASLEFLGGEGPGEGPGWEGGSGKRSLSVACDDEAEPEQGLGGWLGDEYPVDSWAPRVPTRVYGAQSGKVGEGIDRVKAVQKGDGGSSEGVVEEVVSISGTPDLPWQDTLDFEEDEPGEQSAARSPWQEVKAEPGAAGQMASAGRCGGRREAADAPTEWCGGKGLAPAAARGEQRPGPLGIRAGVDFWLPGMKYVVVAVGTVRVISD
ncbi:hypothetical protein NDU88_000948 [Pleurodeles waltl]|uniref:Uncharacterized protein n=1 Tax=Pleurodeles waltl TaxID=8319 RepID=A0AAV7Q4K6_PLEWA|nr:hypothetical protein NDU88_000948 [Pleurodeles waltl]